ncbi:30S ribosomal protein S8 [Candidatus Kaiserbacteria bacterium]|nr:30S ribosomal protein S8 [Candidatus Kaiserbacteria bacterium]
MVNDPIADLLVQLKNASRVGKTAISLPYSQMKAAIADVLSKEGYVGAPDKKNYSLVIPLSYKNGEPAISGTKRLSKPSRRVYLGVRDVRSVKRGHGLLVLSTPKGILTGTEARAQRVGGEVLFEIW